MAFTRVLASVVIGMLCFAMMSSAAQQPVDSTTGKPFDKYNMYNRLNAGDMDKLQEYKTSPAFQQQASSAFTQFDSNADGFITITEVRFGKSSLYLHEDIIFTNMARTRRID